MANPSNQAWFCYLVECSDQTLYCGIAKDIARRLQQHNGELVGGAKYTATRRPVELKAQWEFADRSAASKFEYQIKQLSRQKKLELISEQQASYE